MINIRFNFFPPPGPELRSFYGSANVTGTGTVRLGTVTYNADGVIGTDAPRTFDIDDLRRMSLEERILRFRCVEAWAMVVPWAYPSFLFQEEAMVFFFGQVLFQKGAEVIEKRQQFRTSLLPPLRSLGNRCAVGHHQGVEGEPGGL